MTPTVLVAVEIELADGKCISILTYILRVDSFYLQLPFDFSVRQVMCAKASLRSSRLRNSHYEIGRWEGVYVLLLNTNLPGMVCRESELQPRTR